MWSGQVGVACTYKYLFHILPHINARTHIQLYMDTQLVDIDHQTIIVAQWSLVLSQLIFFYEHCTTEQLASVAEGVVSSLVEGEGVRVCGGDCVSLCDVVEHFLASEGLMEMRKLQELLVVKCISFSMSVLRKM